jgi:predicted outer membrane repeat protein
MKKSGKQLNKLSSASCLVQAAGITRPVGLKVPPWGNVIKLRGKPFWKRVFPLRPRHRGSLFPKTFKSFGKMAWKKPFFKRVSSKISARMLNLMALPSWGRAESLCGRRGEGAIWPRIYRAVYLVLLVLYLVFGLALTGGIVDIHQAMAAQIDVYPGGSIQQAINTAGNGDEIIVHQGTYTENINFSGKAITVRSQNPADPAVVAATIIDGGQAGSVVTFENAEGIDSVLSGFTVRNGKTGSSGGGIDCYFSSMTITDCTITGNSAYNGAGICSFSSSMTRMVITNCTITGNSASCGGGIFCYSSEADIANCTISKNSASQSGGGIYCQESLLTATNCIISENSTSQAGGGIFFLESLPTITNCTISGNSAGQSGGGIYCDFSSPYIVNSIFWGNTSDIYAHSGSNPKLSYCDLQGSCPGLGNISADPRFVDPAHADYRLRSGSPCINTGHPRIRDRSDNNLPSDMGAYGGDGGYDSNPQNITVAADGSGQFTSIQDAINYAVTGDTIIVLPGTYRENLVMGGKEPSLISQNGAQVTIIDGNRSGSVISLIKVGQGAEINGFTIRNGFSSQAGGGILCYSSSPSINNCIVSGNSAAGDSGSGGGIACQYESSPTIAYCTISANSATGSYACGGGGISCSDSSSPNITNCTISGNSTSGYQSAGGGISCSESSSPAITNCIISENSTIGSLSDGAAISCYDCYDYYGYSCPTITNCTISKNSTSANGGSIYCYYSLLTITNCIIWDNLPYEISRNNYESYLTISYCDIHQEGYIGEGNINANPQFINEGTANFRLGSGSPCINGGTSSAGIPFEDKDGNPRRDGQPDMGAYEAIDYDVIPPVARCKGITVQLDASGMAAISAANIDNGSYDDHGIASMTVSPDTFTCANIGANTVTLTVIDTSANQSTCTAIVTVEDKTPPGAGNFPATITISSDPGQCGAVGNWTQPAFTDTCSTPTVHCDHNPGDFLPVGPAQVTCTATDRSGNSTDCSFTVTVKDTEPPQASGCPDDITIGVDPGQCSATATWTAPIFTDNCNTIASVSCNHNPGDSFPTGPTTVTYTARDSSGNSASCSFTVTVKESEAPVARCKNSVVTIPFDASGKATVTALGVDGVDSVDDGSSDNCAIGTMTVSPDTFTAADLTAADTGIRTVTLTVTDKSGNSNTCMATVHLIDTIGPVINCPANLTVEAQGAGGVLADSDTIKAFLNGVTALDAIDGSVSVSNDAPTVFSLGSTTQVTFRAADRAGNVSTCTTIVSVVDTTGPVITCPATNIFTVETEDADGVPAGNAAIQNFLHDVTAFDVVDGPVNVSNDAPAEFFGIGTTQVTFSAIDRAGNVNSTSNCCPVQVLVRVASTAPPGVFLNTVLPYRNQEINNCPQGEFGDVDDDGKFTVADFRKLILEILQH